MQYSTMPGSQARCEPRRALAVMASMTSLAGELPATLGDRDLGFRTWQSAWRYFSVEWVLRRLAVFVSLALRVPAVG